MCCLTLYILRAWKWLQALSSGNHDTVPLAPLGVPGKDPREEMDRSHIRKRNYSLLEKGTGRLLYTGFINSLTLLCTCRGVLFGVTCGCLSLASVLAVSLQGHTPFAVSNRSS